MRKEGEAFYQEKHKLQKTSGRGIFRQEKVAQKASPGQITYYLQGLQSVEARKSTGEVQKSINWAEKGGG